MLYQREINDPVLIQFIILYTLNQAKIMFRTIIL